MNREELRTYQEWQRAGRQVQRGARAEFFLRSPDGQRSRPLFSREQTTEAEEPDLTGWTDIVAATEHRKPLPGAPKRRLAKADYVSDGGWVHIWVGSNSKGIELLKQYGFAFQSAGYRWVAQRENFAKVCHALEAHGFDVEATRDGEPYDYRTELEVTA